jgi:hypothetical protein
MFGIYNGNNYIMPVFNHTDVIGGIIQYNTTQNGYYKGLEDIRILNVIEKINIKNLFGESVKEEMRQCFLYNCNRGIGKYNITVECGEIRVYENAKKISTSNIPIDDYLYLTTTTENTTLFETTNSVEKNWVCFIDKEKNICKFIYQWGCPMIIGEKRQKEFIKTNQINTPPFFKNLRGSSNGLYIPLKGEWLFVCHLVSYEERRFYYHCFVILDENTFKVKRYSTLWTFEKSPIEYCLSIVFSPINERHVDNLNDTNNNIIIGYSVMDSTTKFIEVSMEYIETIMIQNDIV